MHKSLLAFILILTPVFSGVLFVTSDPSGATIFIDDQESGIKTPANLTVANDTISVLVALDNYHFQPRIIAIEKNDTVNISFTHLPILDTISIAGNSLFGILYLPKPPIELPYLIDEYINEEKSAIVLPEGEHKLHWDGSISFKTVDTTILIKAGEVNSVNFNFEKRYSKIKLTTMPKDAEIYLDDILIGIGDILRPTLAGTHKLKVERNGYETLIKNVILFPERSFRDTIILEPTKDTDNDGFPDSTDLCPNRHGIYNGCPEINKGNEMKNVTSFFASLFWNQPFTIEVSAINFQNRIALNQHFRDIISLYNDGSGLFNNYRGINALNKIWISKNIFIISGEVSQNFMKLQYKKPYKINPFYDENQLFDSTLSLSYSDFYDITPTLSIFDATVMGGIRLISEYVGVSILFGWQYETIEFENVTEKQPSSLKSALIGEKRVNSNFITTIRGSITPFKRSMAPTFYGEMSFTPRDNAEITGWLDGRIGIIIPWYRTENKAISKN